MKACATAHNESMRIWLLLALVALGASAEPYPRAHRYPTVRYVRAQEPQPANAYEPVDYPQVERLAPAARPRASGTAVPPQPSRPATGWTVRPASGNNWVISAGQNLPPGSLLSIQRDGATVASARVLQCGNGVALAQLVNAGAVQAGDAVVVERLAPPAPEIPRYASAGSLPANQDPRYQEWLRRGDVSFSPGRIYGRGFYGSGFYRRSYYGGFSGIGYRSSFSCGRTNYRASRPAPVYRSFLSAGRR